MPTITKHHDPRPPPRRTRLPPQRWIALLLVCFGLVTLDVLFDGPLRRADLPVSAWLSKHVHGSLWECARVLAGVGQRRLVAIPLGAATLAAAWRRRSWRPVLLTIGILVMLDVTVTGLKDAVGRTGPGEDSVLNGGKEYPSGHTINGVVMWGVALRLLRDAAGPSPWLTGRRRWLLALLTGLGAGVGVLAINWHWLTDVVAGWLLGPPALWLALRSYGEPGRGEEVSVQPPRSRMIVRR